MRTLEELNEELQKLNITIKRIVKESQFNDYDDLSGLTLSEINPDEQFLKDELLDVMNQLYTASQTLTYIRRPVKQEGKLRRTSTSRYALEGKEFTCGTGIEALITTEICVEGQFQEGYKWIAGRIEHDGQDYYIAGVDKNIGLEGLRVRIR